MKLERRLANLIAPDKRQLVFMENEGSERVRVDRKVRDVAGGERNQAAKTFERG